VLRRATQNALPLVLLLAVAACGGSDTVKGPAPGAPQQIHLTSAAFTAGASIPRQYTCDGDETSPPLSWTKAPAGASSLALLMEDPDAPNGTFVHWTVYGLPPTTTSLPAATPPARAKQGTNSFGKRGYNGPCPPPADKAHRYVFTLYALRSKPTLKAGASPKQVRAAIAKVALARGRLIGRYKRG
jgi:Raf kinase inhibitor-like YbhB/YbcL family protein